MLWVAEENTKYVLFSVKMWVWVKIEGEKGSEITCGIIQCVHIVQENTEHPDHRSYPV